MTWQETQNGFGLEEIKEPLLREQVCCVICGQSSKGKLYTDRNCGPVGNRKALKAQLEEVSKNAYCKVHATWWFNQEEE